MEDQREQQEQKFREMTQAPVGRLVGRLAFPCIISMLVTAFCNMADTFFVGMMDSNAATGFFSALAAVPCGVELPHPPWHPCWVPPRPSFPMPGSICGSSYWAPRG